jgi:hypothetical protein
MSNQRNVSKQRHLRKVNLTQSPRELHLIDIENELGCSRFTIADVAAFRLTYLEQVKPAVDAHIVIATSSHMGLVSAGIGWPDARKLLRPGRDGADLALAQVVLEENVEHRFTDITVASGDGIFADIVTALRRIGIRVSVVASSHVSVSRKLVAAAGGVHRLTRTRPAVAA